MPDPVRSLLTALQRPVVRQAITALLGLTLGSSPSVPAEEAKPSEQSFDAIVKGAEKHEGLFTLYKVKRDLYMEIAPSQLETPFLRISSLGSGLGERNIYYGHPRGDALVLLRRVDDQVLLIQPNMRFRAPTGSALARSVRRSFPDSIVTAFKVEAVHPERKTLLIKLNSYLHSDLGTLLDGLNPPGSEKLYSLNADRSYWGSIRAFPNNVELDAVLVYEASQWVSLGSVPDPRGFPVTMHHSFSRLPESDYRPRLGDPRLGYDSHRIRDETEQERNTLWKRYIHRWNQRKRDPQAPLSPPLKPIVFYLENTIPQEYRLPIRDGLLMWNRAFERVGIRDAIEVREQPDDADWDGGDVRYNTVRWVSSTEAGYAAGGGIVHPLTGEILKATIVIQGNMMRAKAAQYEEQLNPSGALPRLGASGDAAQGWCALHQQASAELAFGLTALELGAVPAPDAEKKRFLLQYLRYVAAHEMGHCLGLPHNLRGSALLPLRDLHNPAITSTRGLSSSVMDYLPPNLAPPGTTQGDYFPQTLGPHDLWVIEYAYTTIKAETPEEELPALRRIAARSALPGLAWGDEGDLDVTSELADPDPITAPWDLSRDPLGWSEQRLRLCRDRLRRLESYEPPVGGSFTEVRRKFAALLDTYLGLMLPISRYVGGLHTARSFRGDPGAGPPLKLVPVAEQRRALRLLANYLFDASAFRFSPAMLNRLGREVAPEMEPPARQRADYPVREQILNAQKEVLTRLLHPMLLSRIVNGEMRVSNPAETLTLQELFPWLTQTIWSEVERPRPLQSIPVLRRGLQRQHLSMLIALMIQPAPGTPDDARNLAWAELTALRSRLGAARSAPGARDASTRAHLAESAARLGRALDARVTAPAW